MPDKLDVLKRVDLLSMLNLHELTELADDFEWQDFSEGSFILEEGGMSKGFFVLVEGQAEVFVNRKGHAPIHLRSFTPYDAFGEIDLFVDRPCSASVRCLENCRLLVLNRDRFAFMLIRWPALHAGFIERLSRRLGWSQDNVVEEDHRNFLRSSLLSKQRKFSDYEFWGSPSSIKFLEKSLDFMAGKGNPLLLTGEPGSGKLLISWFYHKSRFGVDAPFIVMDGRHLDQEWGDTLFDPPDESSPMSQVNCLLEIAQGGTLFIRDINLISPIAQLKLARLLQARVVPCCIIGSTVAVPELLSVPLLPQLRECFGKPVQVLPLRERKKDIPIIIENLLKRFGRQYGKRTPALSNDALKLLLNHNYRRGNVAELIQIMERSFFLADGDNIGLEHLFFGPTSYKSGYTFNLLSWNWLHNAIKRGLVPLLFQQISLLVLWLVIFKLLILPHDRWAGYGLLLIFGFWWPAVVTSAFVLGRIWCTACPVSYFMELVRKLFRRDLPVPNVLKRYDYLINTFLFLLIFWIEAVLDLRHNPVYTGILLLSITLAAAVTGVVFARHSWCRYLCPFGALIGVASINGMLEVRADPDICLNNCTTHECFRGTRDAEGCPMAQYPAYLDNNQACKLCLRCIRNCPNESVKLNLRTPAREIWHLSRINQGYVLFIGTALAILIPISLFEPFRNVWPHREWIFWYSLIFWGTAVSAGSITWFLARPFSTKLASRRIKLVFALIPLLTAGFMAYQFNFVPGADSLSLLLYSNVKGIRFDVAYVSILRLIQGFAAFPGFLLTGLAIIMVLISTTSKKKKSRKGIRRAPASKGPKNNLSDGPTSPGHKGLTS